MTKLFNFLQSQELNRARQGFRAPLLPTAALLKPYGIDPNTAQQLLENGKEIFRHLIQVKNHCLYYQDILVSVNLGRVKSGLPRLHIAYCKKMHDFNRNQYDSFFISRALHPKRTVYIDNMSIRRESEIPICKYCLELLGWQNYRYELATADKNRIVSTFKLKDYYRLYDRPQVHRIFMAMDRELKLNQ